MGPPAPPVARRASIDFDGASGPLDLDEKGDPTAGVCDIYRFLSGEPETVKQVEVSD